MDEDRLKDGGVEGTQDRLESGVDQTAALNVDNQAVWASVPVGELGLGDKLRLRKAHPCGGFEWEVVRLGADIGLVCLTCGHKVFLSRRELKRRMKTHFPKEQ